MQWLPLLCVIATARAVPTAGTNSAKVCHVLSASELCRQNNYDNGMCDDQATAACFKCSTNDEDTRKKCFKYCSVRFPWNNVYDAYCINSPFQCGTKSGNCCYCVWSGPKVASMNNNVSHPAKLP